MSDFKEQIKVLNADYQSALTKNDNETYSKFSLNLADAQSAVREYIQEITKDQINAVIGKLKGNQKLSKAEIDYIRLWLVSDAEDYIKHENDLENWKAESKRVMDQINAFQKPNPTFEEASKLRALLVDLTRTTSDINFYLQQKERVEKFNEATHELDSEECELLINLLTSKKNSKDY
jgi:hypothetical protein